jgi:hypothetical protein
MWRERDPVPSTLDCRHKVLSEENGSVAGKGKGGEGEKLFFRSHSNNARVVFLREEALPRRFTCTVVE